MTLTEDRSSKGRSDADETDAAPDSMRAVVPEDIDGSRLDKALTLLYPQFSRTRLQALIDSGDCVVNDKTAITASVKVRSGDIVFLSEPPAVDATPKPENIPLNIVYEDASLIVLNKAAGMVVHPGAGNDSGTLVNALLYHCGDTLSGINGVRRPGIVHRLDKETTGLMIVAKDDRAHQYLSAQLQDRSLSRIYEALVVGLPFPRKGEIEGNIGRHPANRLKMAVVKGGREALTYYTVKENFSDALALVECRLATGRTHQIRVHFEKIKHPLIGDPLYGLQATGVRAGMRKGGFGDTQIEQVLSFPRQALHARSISFLHPENGERLSFDSGLPLDMAGLLSGLTR